ncbi:hypothetical protein ABIC85_001687 [Oerskovia enterophila]
MAWRVRTVANPRAPDPGRGGAGDRTGWACRVRPRGVMPARGAGWRLAWARPGRFLGWWAVRSPEAGRCCSAGQCQDPCQDPCQERGPAPAAGAARAVPAAQRRRACPASTRGSVKRAGRTGHSRVLHGATGPAGPGRVSLGSSRAARPDHPTWGRLCARGIRAGQDAGRSTGGGWRPWCPGTSASGPGRVRVRVRVLVPSTRFRAHENEVAVAIPSITTATSFSAPALQAPARAQVVSPRAARPRPTRRGTASTPRWSGTSGSPRRARRRGTRARPRRPGCPPRGAGRRRPRRAAPRRGPG